MSKPLITFDEVKELLGLSTRTLNQMRAKGTLPAPFVENFSVCMWKRSEIEELLGCKTEVKD